MTKNSIHSKIKEIKNFEEHGNELMEEIFNGNVDWKMTEDGNYINKNKKGNYIINSNNFSPEQNKKLKDRFSYFRDFRERGRGGRIKEPVISINYINYLPLDKNKLVELRKIKDKYEYLVELRNEHSWFQKGFTSEQRKKWIEVGAKPDDYEFVAWLRDEKNKDDEKFAEPNWVKEKIATKELDLNELRKTYQQKFQENKVDILQAKIEIIQPTCGIPGRAEK